MFLSNLPRSVKFLPRRAPRYLSGTLRALPVAAHFSSKGESSSTPGETVSYDAILEKNLPPADLARAKVWLYGNPCSDVHVPATTQEHADQHNFELKAFKIPAQKEQKRTPKVVRIGLIQNKIVLETTSPVEAQAEAIRDRIEIIAKAAGDMGVNVLCLQETFHMPFAFCTREKTPWVEFAESAENGASVLLCQKLAREYNMVVVCPILERAQDDVVHNTAVVISHTGSIIGKHRKNHIPRVGDFNESTYYMEGETGHPVFETKYGKIAVNICYGRHFPLNWQIFALNGADIIFNPSATVGTLSEPMWSIEARNAAIANSVFTCGINRVGTESFPNEFTSGDGRPAHHDFGHFYGSSYVAAPDASRTPGLSRTEDGLLVTEVDLNMCRQIKDKWGFHMTKRMGLYADYLNEYCYEDDFSPQVIKDPSLDA